MRPGAGSRPALLLPLLALYLAPRLWLLLTTGGSYIDEYKHLASGLEYFDSGRFASFYAGGVTYRGAHISVWSGLWMWLFGKSLAVAKLSALSLGAASFALYADVARRAFVRRSVVVLFGLLYAISPWLIFNSLYVRMYVVYELFLAALVWLTWQAISAFETKRMRRGFLALAAIVALNAVNRLLSHGPGQYILLAGTAIVFGYFFVFRAAYFSTLLARLRVGFLERSRLARLALIAVVAGLGLYFSGALGGLQLLFGGSMPFKAKVHYWEFFGSANAVATTLFVLGLISLPFIREAGSRMTFWRAVLPVAEPRLYVRRDGVRYSAYGKVPVIHDLEQAGPGGLCLVVREPSARKFVTAELVARLEEQAEEIVRHHNITVYLFSGPAPSRP